MNGYGRADFCARVTSTRLFTQRVLVDLAALHDDLEFFSGSFFSNHPYLSDRIGLMGEGQDLPPARRLPTVWL